MSAGTSMIAGGSGMLIMNGTARCVNTGRSLTRSSGISREGLAMKATQRQRRQSPEVQARRRAWSRWRNMIQRCTDQSDQDYALYGGRGITVCPEWLASFDAYYAHVGDKPDGLSLDRTNNELGYFPGNVRWATAKEQAANRRYSPKTHCPSGHPYDEPNTRIYNGRRHCRKCAVIAQRVYRRRKRARALA